MKPLKLSLRGFMTYKNQIDIDFSKLYKKKIFVISGDTGSGKTSIFDAITYALYGQVARGIDVSSLRSDFLNENDPYTYVNLVFEVDARIYEIERIPSQFAYKSKANQDIKAQVTLYDITDSKKVLAEKKGTTDKRINEIIDLDKNQFSKVMLLAQGDFQQFLLAKSDERTKLLGDIFKTYEYKNIQDMIKSEANARAKDMELIDENLDMIIYQNEDISKNVNRDDILIHDFSSINKSLLSFRQSLDISFKDLGKKEDELSLREKEKIAARENAISINTNIEKYLDINKEKDELEKNENYYKNLKKEYDQATYARAIKIYEDRYNKAGAEYETLSQNLRDLRDKKERAQADFAKIENDYQSLGASKSRLTELNITLNDLKTKVEHFKEFKDLEEKYQAYQVYEQDLKEAKLIGDDLSKDLEGSKETMDQLSHSLRETKEKVLGLRQEILEKENEKRLIDDQITLANKNKENQQKISKNLEAIKDLEASKAPLRSRVNSYYENQRLIELNKFIDELNEKNICPVCGDSHQDQFDKFPIVDIDIKEVNNKLSEISAQIASYESENDLLENSLVTIEDEDQLMTKFETIRAGLSSAKDKLSINNKYLADLSKKEEKNKNILDDLNKKITSQKAKISDLEATIKDGQDLKLSYLSTKKDLGDLDIKQVDKDIGKVKEKITSLETDIDQVSENYSKQKSNLAKLLADIANTEKTISQIEKDKAQFLEEFKQKLSENFKTKELYDQALESFDLVKDRKSDIDTFFKDLYRLRTLYDDYQIYKDKSPIVIKDIDEDLKKLANLLKDTREAKADLYQRLKNIDQTLKALDKLKATYEDISAKAHILQKLAKVADGSFAKVAGREKIDFESFVLTYYFDKVLTYANKRLYVMTNGQFSMHRKSYGRDFRKKQGLDLEILDANTGKMRPASTLSGGESFLTSLALALGLSDEISAENGGITIDTLFIDEGFGTLSEDYLAKVIEQIEKLSYENKFIGLISHVNELKDAIDGKILVSYTSDEGSFIEVKA